MKNGHHLGFYLCIFIAFFGAIAATGRDWTFPWEKCVSMDQIVGRKCERSYYICDFGDQWFTHEVLCNHCIGDCPPGRVFDNSTEICVWPNTIGCACTRAGEVLGTKCDSKFYICRADNDGGWLTDERMCEIGTVYDPETTTCRVPNDIGC